MGSVIVEALKDNWVEDVLDVKEPVRPRAGVRYHTGDVTSPAEVENLFKMIRPLVVIHSAGIVPGLASRYGSIDRDRVFNINVDGTRNVLAAAQKYGVQALVWTSSCTCVTDDMAC